MKVYVLYFQNVFLYRRGLIPTLGPQAHPVYVPCSTLDLYWNILKHKAEYNTHFKSEFTTAAVPLHSGSVHIKHKA